MWSLCERLHECTRRINAHKMQQDGVAFNMDIDIIGTPDEEATGCKVDMCNAGCLKTMI